MRTSFFFLVAIVSMLISCQKDNLNLNSVQKSVEQTEIPSIETPLYISGGLKYYLVGGPPDGMPPGTGFCDYAPGFCQPDWNIPNPWPYNPVINNGSFYEDTGHDAVFLVDLNIENGTMSFQFVDIRDEWFDEGGYIDGTFSVPELPLGPELAAHFGLNEIHLNEGVYEMINDEETGNYLVNMDVTIN